MDDFSTQTLVSESDINAIRLTLPKDQADHLKPGCITWPLTDPDKTIPKGRMTVWPEEGRAAVAYGDGASAWGDWNPKTKQLTLDDKQTSIDERGTILERPTVAVSLTEDQVKLLLSAEYPQDGQKQNTALDEIFAGNPIPIENESVLLDYSNNTKTFFAKLEANEKPALDAKLTQLQLDKERDQQATIKAADRQNERQYTPSRSKSRDYQR